MDMETESKYHEHAGEITVDDPKKCPRCEFGGLDVIDIHDDGESDEPVVMVGCDECRHVEYLSLTEAQERGFVE